jgi:hypothetical protein
MMIEDDTYRASSQYRLWSYTEQTLAQIRQTTNNLASERVKAAFRRAQAARSAENGSLPDPENVDQAKVDVQTLTVDEELKIVEWGCSKIQDMGEAMNPRIPSNVVVRRSMAYSQVELVCFIPRLFSHFSSSVTGYGNSISPPLLSYEFAHDV